jgi:hypothetical protein
VAASPSLYFHSIAPQLVGAPPTKQQPPFDGKQPCPEQTLPAKSVERVECRMTVPCTNSSISELAPQLAVNLASAAACRFTSAVTARWSGFPSGDQLQVGRLPTRVWPEVVTSRSTVRR